MKGKFQFTNRVGCFLMNQDQYSNVSRHFSSISSSSLTSSSNSFKLNAIVLDNYLRDYLNGLLNTILFIRLLGIIEPLEDIPLANHSFESIVYPVINNNKNISNKDDLINRSPQSWVSNKIKSLMNSYDEKINKKQKTNSLGDVFTKIIFVLKFFNVSDNQTWEIWVIDLDVLDSNIINKESISSSAYFTNPVDKLKSNGKSKDFTSLHGFLSNDMNTKIKLMRSSFESNMFNIIKFSESNIDNMPSIKTQDMNPFSIKTDYLINWRYYISNLDFNLDLDLNLSSLHNSTDLSQESIEYINTTDNGDIIISSGSNSENDISNKNKGPKDDLWKNGYNFFKKMLE